VANVYRFSQFYGNMFVALLLLTVLKWGLSPSQIAGQRALFVLALMGTAILFLSHRRSLSETYSRLTDILTPLGKEAEEHEEGRKEESRPKIAQGEAARKTAPEEGR
jgi:hypothetical protein